jgi:hypothetical protein
MNRWRLKKPYLAGAKRYGVDADQVIGFIKICIGKPQGCQGKVGARPG